MRWMSAVVALALLPSVAPDLFDLGCPHHLGHADAEGHAHHAGHPGPAMDHAPAGGHFAPPTGGHDTHDGTLPFANGPPLA